MHQKDFSISYKTHTGTDSLSEPDNEMLEKAKEATQSAYAPYSKFKVGVAIRTESDQIITGSNQENGSYPIGQCAERVALYRLAHEYGRTPISAIAVVVDHAEQVTPASPCGSCRQILFEYRNNQTSPIRILMASANGNEIWELSDVNDLLPFAFNGKFLGQ